MAGPTVTWRPRALAPHQTHTSLRLCARPGRYCCCRCPWLGAARIPRFVRPWPSCTHRHPLSCQPHASRALRACQGECRGACGGGAAQRSKHRIAACERAVGCAVSRGARAPFATTSSLVDNYLSGDFLLWRENPPVCPGMCLVKNTTAPLENLAAETGERGRGSATAWAGRLHLTLAALVFSPALLVGPLPPPVTCEGLGLGNSRPCLRSPPPPAGLGALDWGEF